MPLRPAAATAEPTKAGPVPRSILLALAVTGLLWILAARAGADQTAISVSRLLHLPSVQPLLSETLFLAFLLAGFVALSWIATRRGGLREVNALPVRATSREEWKRGAAIGWGMLVAAVIPMMLAGDLHPQFWWQPRSWGLAVLSVLALAAGSLAVEVAFRGFVFRSLIEAVGPVTATASLSVFCALLAIFQPNTTALSFLLTLTASVLFAVAYLRTRALWLGWGLRFGWLVAMGVLFGLPIDGSSDHASLVATDTTGAGWMTGGPFGPEGALPGLIVILLGFVVLYRVTREYAWEYTFDPIVSAGYAMDIAPPAAHQAMEKAAAKAPAPLVQIQMTTAAGASSMTAVNEHLATQSAVPPAPGDRLDWGAPAPSESLSGESASGASAPEHREE